MNESGIYQIINRINGKRYIGSAVCFRKRFSIHKLRLRRQIHHSPHLQAAWDKYGEKSFTFEPIIICARPNLVMYEQRYMDGLLPEYNVCPNAASWIGHKHSAESRAKMTASRTGKTLSASHIANMSKVRMGKKLSPEHLAALVKANTGRSQSAEVRKKISDARKGHSMPVEVRKKISASHTGVKRPPFSAEAIEKMAVGQRARRQRERDERLYT